MAQESESWGGRREGAGRKPAWNSGRCKTVKLPAALAEAVLRYARELDGGAAPAARSERDWDLLTRAIDEKVALQAQLRQATERLAAVERAESAATAKVARQNAQAMDAYRALSDALVEHRRTKRSIRVGDLEQALGALSGYADFPRRARPAPPAEALTAEAQDAGPAATTDEEERERERHQAAVEIAELKLRLADREYDDRDLHGRVRAASAVLRRALDHPAGPTAEDVQEALTTLTSPYSGPGAAAPRTRDARWAQVSKLLDEKVELEKVLKQLRATLATERRKTAGAEARTERETARIREAVAILGAALREHELGVHRGVSLRDVRSALGNLTGWAEQAE